MANNKPAARNWSDVQIAIATVSMALTLVFWNLFAGPDRASALKRAQEQAAQDQAAREQAAQEQAAQAAQAQAAQAQPQSAPAVIVQPTPTQLAGPILFGGSAPQTTIIVQNGGNHRGGGGGGGGGGGTGGS